MITHPSGNLEKLQSASGSWMEKAVRIIYNNDGFMISAYCLGITYKVYMAACN